MEAIELHNKSLTGFFTMVKFYITKEKAKMKHPDCLLEIRDPAKMDEEDIENADFLDKSIKGLINDSFLDN